MVEDGLIWSSPRRPMFDESGGSRDGRVKISERENVMRMAVVRYLLLGGVGLSGRGLIHDVQTLFGP